MAALLWTADGKRESTASVRNIAQVYGFESDTPDDRPPVHFLAMALVPGEAARNRSTPIRRNRPSYPSVEDDREGELQPVQEERSLMAPA